jgi:glycosyltransferase involved in cell wall biosynthesis
MAGCNILLSTYNGSRFLPELLDSLAAQDYPGVRVHIRDDGSSDATPQIARDYAGRNRSWGLELGNRLGVFRSFMALLAGADATCAYFAFCDQDDVWLGDRISRAVSTIGSAAEPVLYFSRSSYVGRDLRFIKYSPVPRHIGFESAIVGNVAAGCTMVMNQAARRLLLRKVPAGLFLHDWWCYLVVCALGRIVFDPEPRILQRRHAANATYATVSGLTKQFYRMRRWLTDPGIRGYASLQARKLLECFDEDMDSQRRAMVNQFVNMRSAPFRERLAFALKNTFKRQSALDQLLLKAMIIANWY